MIQTVEAVVDAKGQVPLLGAIHSAARNGHSFPPPLGVDGRPPPFELEGGEVFGSGALDGGVGFAIC